MALTVTTAVRKDRNTVEVEFVVGSTRPTAATTGVAGLGASAAALPVYPATGGPFGPIVSDDSGPTLNLTTDGVTVEGWNIPALVKPKCSGWTIRRCLIRGGSVPVNNVPTASTGLVFCNDSANSGGGLVEFCDLIPDYPSNQWTGIFGHDFTARRNNIQRVVDGVNAFAKSSTPNGSTNAQFLGNHVDNLRYISPDQGHAGDSPVSHSHNDCVQLFGGAGTVIRGNNLSGFCQPVGDILLDSAHANSDGGYNIHYPYLQANSCVQISQSQGLLTGLVLEQNWMDGGAQMLNVSTSTGTYSSFGSVAGNRCGQNQRPDIPSAQRLNVPASATGLTTSMVNVDMVDASTVTISRA